MGGGGASYLLTILQQIRRAKRRVDSLTCGMYSLPVMRWSLRYMWPSSKRAAVQSLAQCCTQAHSLVGETQHQDQGKTH